MQTGSTISLPPTADITGCLLGAAVGDSIGLPYEGLSTLRAHKMARFPLEQGFVLGQGMVSDDTDHAIFVLQSIIVSDGNPMQFRQALAWRLRWWLITMPAGVGFATFRSIVKMWLGFRASGVLSAGNGPSMRSAIIGTVFCNAPDLRQQYVEQSTALTHTDQRALAGARAVAEVAAHIASGEWKTRPRLAEFVAVLKGVSPIQEWQDAVAGIARACRSHRPMQIAQIRFGNRFGISGYSLHSVPFALIAWYAYHRNFRATIETAVMAGGNVDTVGAIAGALAGLTQGEEGIPSSWRKRLRDWPHSRSYMRRLAARARDPGSAVMVSFSPFLWVRSLVFVPLVLCHGLRRLFPPY